MKVLMMPDALVFVDLTESQVTDVMNACDSSRIKDTVKGLKVQDKPDVLFKALYELSYKYDIELV